MGCENNGREGVEVEERKADNGTPMTVRLVNVEEMAQILGVPVSWLYQRTRLNTIPCVRVGKYVRFKPEEVLASFQATERSSEAQ